MKRICLALGCAAVLALVAGAQAQAADANERPLNAQLVLHTVPGEFTCGNCGPGGTPQVLQTCSYGVFVQFPDVKGAEDYNIVLKDNHPRVNTTYDRHGPPFDDEGADYKAPAGFHWFGAFTGGSFNSTCDQAPDDTKSGRFEILKAVAIMGQERVVSGTLRAKANGGPGRIPVNLVGFSGGKWRFLTRTTSEVSGDYELRVPASAKKVTKFRVGVDRHGWCVTGERTCAETAELTFDRSGNQDHRTVNFETHGRHAKTWGSASVRHPAGSVRVD